MKELQINIYYCSNKHIHIILKGQGRGEVEFSNFGMFLKFIEECQKFCNQRGGMTKVPKVFLDAFREEEI